MAKDRASIESEIVGLKQILTSTDYKEIGRAHV